MAPKENQRDSQPKSKLMHSLASPFPDPMWPQIDATSQETILDLFCQLLEPLGQHHRNVPRSKGKRKKRERANKTEHEELEAMSNLQPIPETESYLTVGFRSTHRLLENMVSSQRHIKSKPDDLTESPKDRSPSNLAAVFVDRSSQPSVMIKHLPIMMATAARSLGPESSIWLVTFPNASEDKLRKVMAIPRVGLFGLMREAPGAAILLEYIKSHVPPVEPLNFSSIDTNRFMPLDIETKVIEVSSSKAMKRQKHKTTNIDAATTDDVKTKKAPDTATQPAKKKQRR